MNKLIYISILIIGLTACKTVKQSTHATERTADTSEQITTTQTNRDKETYRNRIERDSAIVLPEKSVSDTIKYSDTEIPRTSNGTAVPRYFTKEVSGVKAWVAIDTNNNVAYGCDVASITLVVKSLIRDSIMMHERYDSLAAEYKRLKQVSTSKQVTVKEVQKTWWGRNWRKVVGAAVFVVIMIIIGAISGFFKRYKL